MPRDLAGVGIEFGGDVTGRAVSSTQDGQSVAGESRTNNAQTVQSDGGRSVQGTERKKASIRSARNDHGDWLKEQARKRSRAQIHNATGLTPRGAENIRLGESKISFDALTEWLMNDPLLRAEYFQYCGGRLDVPPEVYAGFARAFNAYMVKTQKGMAE